MHIILTITYKWSQKAKVNSWSAVIPWSYQRCLIYIFFCVSSFKGVSLLSVVGKVCENYLTHGTFQTEDELQVCQKQLSDANEALEKAKEDEAAARKECKEQSR